MIQQSTLNFLIQLGKNNNKPWFEANRKKYEAAKADDLAFITKLLAGFESFDPGIAALEPKKCLFRINRDVRFSANKNPYKTNMGAWMNEGGKKVWNGGYYFHLEPGKSFLAAGMYMPEAPMLAKIRQEIDYNFDTFKKVFEDKKFLKIFGGLSKEQGQMLSRPPKGYDAQNPAIEYLKLKSFVAVLQISDTEITDKGLLKHCLTHFKLLSPMVKFFNDTIRE